MDTLSVLDIQHYVQMGFQKVCTVHSDRKGQWYYKNINESLMYSSHNSWVYFIVVNGIIAKVGETGVPLGIKSTRDEIIDGRYVPRQPTRSTESRFGRYRAHDGTDDYIRNRLKGNILNNDQVELWAYKCEGVPGKHKFINEDITINAHIHKQMELILLDYIYDNVCEYPLLNKGRK